MKLSEWMQEKGLDQVGAEIMLEVDQSTISRILAGKSCSVATMNKIYANTDGNVTPNDLLGMSDD